MKKQLNCVPLITLLSVFFFLYQPSKAQIDVISSGKVGIGEPNPLAKLTVKGDTNDAYTLQCINNATNSFLKVGILNTVTNSTAGAGLATWHTSSGSASIGSSAYGVYSNATTYGSGGYAGYYYLNSVQGTGSKYSLYTRILCGTNDGTGARYALYASSGCTNGLAGYFEGDVYVQGTLTQTSDASKKTNVQTLTGALGLISQLKPKTYNYKTAENPTLPSEKQYGFIAQDLEQVLPDLVRDVESYTQTEELDEYGIQKRPEVNGSIKTVNYLALIPILVEGMQEQQALIEEQSKQLAAQAEEIRQLKELSKR